MSVSPNANIDTSTSNANWGTLVIVLLVVIVGVVVGVVALQPHQETNPVLINQSQQTVQPVPAPGPAVTSGSAAKPGTGQ